MRLSLILVVLWVAQKVPAQPAFGGTAQLDRAHQQCVDVDDKACRQDTFWKHSQDNNLNLLLNEQEEDDDEEEEDPMLAKMPGLDFKAYRRADISSMYRDAPGFRSRSRTEQKPRFSGMAGKFVNMSPERLDLYWDDSDGPPGAFNSIAGPFESTGTSTFPGHIFYFIRPKTKEVVCTIRVQEGTSVYYYDPFIANDRNDPSACVPSDRSVLVKEEHLNSSKQLELYQAAQFNRQFAPLYKNFTGGSEWLGNFPTQPPKHRIWRSDYFGEEHFITSRETQFVQLPPTHLLQYVSPEEMRRRNASDPSPLMEYRQAGIMNITIKTVSVSPRIFQIDGFLSDVEVDHILDLALQKNLQRSTTGMYGDHASVSNVRTSRTTWLPRGSSPIMDAIIRRGADVLRIDEALFRQRNSDEHQSKFADTTWSSINLNPINEELQIVHYDQGQQYTAHHDFGYPDTRPNAPSRSINLCLYLNDDGLVGGETKFPRARTADTDDGIDGIPVKGKAMVFYMKLPDGNLDDLSQHAAMPVIEGEKWFANLWMWDPERD